MDEVEHSSRDIPQPVIHDPPPPYAKEEGGADCNSQSPRGPSSDSRGTLPRTSRFPQRLNGYGKKAPSGASYYYLGTSLGEKRLSVCTRCVLAERIESLHIHNGADPEHDILATISRFFYDRQRGQECFDVVLHAIEGLRDVEERVEMYRLRESKWGHRNTFELKIDIGGRPEKFQWRPSKGKEVRGVAGHASGWKLVRMASQGAAVGGKRKDREEGFTSDGKEVVAVMAHTLTMTKDFTFAFLGSGRSGALGDAWETAALLSGIWRWWASVNESGG